MNEFKPVNAIRHPLWWIMLALLICNDFIFKHLTFMPGIITGKLSDFAGLLITPLLMALFFSTCSKRIWLVIHIICGLLFSAVKLIPAIGNLYVTALNFLGFSGQIWFDPTDLAALSMLPLSFFIYPRLKPLFSLPRSQRILQAAAIIIAGFACTASGTASAPRTLTTFDGSLMISDLTFINATDDEITVQVEVLNPHIGADCTKPIDPENYTKDQFNSLGVWTQASGEATSLLPYATRDKKTTCNIVKLTINSVESVIVAWDSDKLRPQNVPIYFDLPITPTDMIDNAILLHRNKKDYYMLAKGDFTLTHWRKDMFAIDYWKM